VPPPVAHSIAVTEDLRWLGNWHSTMLGPCVTEARWVAYKCRRTLRTQCDDVRVGARGALARPALRRRVRLLAESLNEEHLPSLICGGAVHWSQSINVRGTHSCVRQTRAAVTHGSALTRDTLAWQRRARIVRTSAAASPRRRTVEARPEQNAIRETAG
jgi:hypothetical protein